jgi:hypothetical protein
MTADIDHRMLFPKRPVFVPALTTFRLHGQPVSQAWSTESRMRRKRS